MKVPTAPKSTEKRPVLASPHPHQKANLRKADDQVIWSYTKSCETRTGHFLLLRGWFIINRDFLFHGLICKLIYGLIDFSTESDARNAQKGSVLSTTGGESTRRSRNSRQNQEVKWPMLRRYRHFYVAEGYVLRLDRWRTGREFWKKDMKSCFDVVTLHMTERFGTSRIWKQSNSSKKKEKIAANWNSNSSWSSKLTYLFMWYCVLVCIKTR